MEGCKYLLAVSKRLISFIFSKYGLALVLVSQLVIAATDHEVHVWEAGKEDTKECHSTNSTQTPVGERTACPGCSPAMGRLLDPHGGRMKNLKAYRTSRLPCTHASQPAASGGKGDN